MSQKHIEKTPTETPGEPQSPSIIQPIIDDLKGKTKPTVPIADEGAPPRGQPAPAFGGGVEFDGPLSAVMALVRDQVTWERDVAIPVIERALEEGRLHGLTDEDIAGHEPMRLYPDDPCWYERAPVVSRLVIWYARRRGERWAGEAGTGRGA